jgi:hypothetical protein
LVEPEVGYDQHVERAPFNFAEKVKNYEFVDGIAAAAPVAHADFT